MTEKKMNANTVETNVETNVDTNTASKASKPDTEASKPDSKPDANKSDIERLDDVIREELENAEKAKKTEKVKNTPIKDQKDAVITELLKPSTGIKDGKEIEIPVTMSDFFKRLNAVNYCIPISKNLLVTAFGETNGTAIYTDLKRRTERLAYIALKYHNMKFNGGTAKDIKAAKNDTFTALKDVLNRLDYKANEAYKLNANTADTIAERVYNIAYANKADIKDGYTAKPISAMSFLNFVLKLVQVNKADFTNAKNKALSNLAKSMK